MNQANLFRALGNDRRLQILSWLRHPATHFPPQRDGDLVEQGVCGQSIAEKLGITASTLSEHMRILQQAGLVTATRVRQWTFYRRNEERMLALAALMDGL